MEALEVLEPVVVLHNTCSENGRTKLSRCCWDPTGRSVAAADRSGSVYVFDLEHLEDSNVSWRPVSRRSRLIGFAAGRLVMVARRDAPYYVMLVCADRGDEFALPTFEDPPSPAKVGSVSSDGRLGAVHFSASTALTVWDLGRREARFAVPVSIGQFVRQVEFCEDALVARLSDGRLRLWTLRRSDGEIREIRPPPPLRRKITTFSARGSDVVASDGARLFVYDLAKGNFFSADPPNSHPIRQISFSTPGTLIVAGDRLMQFYNAERSTLSPCGARRIGRSTIKRVATSPSGKYFSTVLRSGEANVYVVEANMRTRTQNAPETAETSPKISKDRLATILSHRNEYPAKHRKIIWKILTDLPRVSFVDGPTSPSPASRSQLLIGHLERLTSRLRSRPGLAAAEGLGELLFPFVKLFHKDPEYCFELSVAVLLDHARDWIRCAPSPPLNVLNEIENALAETDPRLLRHFYGAKVTSETYAWRPLRTGFSETLAPDEWASLWDHVLTNGPPFLSSAAVAYVSIHRSTLLKLTRREDFEIFFVSQNPIVMKNFIKKCYSSLDKFTDCSQNIEPLI